MKELRHPEAVWMGDYYDDYRDKVRSIDRQVAEYRKQLKSNLDHALSEQIQRVLASGAPTGEVKAACRTSDNERWVKMRDFAGPMPSIRRGRPTTPGTYVGGARKQWEIHDNRALILPSDDWNLDNEWWALEEILFNSGKEVWVTHWDSTYAPITLTIAWDKYGFESLSKLQDAGEEWQEFSNAIVLFFKNNPDVKKELMKKLAVEK